MSKPMNFTATLSNYAGDLGSVSANTIEELRREIAKEFLNTMEAGDTIAIIDNYED